MFHSQLHRCILVLGPQFSICTSPIQRESASLEVNTLLIASRGQTPPLFSNLQGGKNTVTKVTTSTKPASTHPTGPPVIQSVCSLLPPSLSLSFSLLSSAIKSQYTAAPVWTLKLGGHFDKGTWPGDPSSSI